MPHYLAIAFQVVRALGPLHGLRALLIEWVRPYSTVHRVNRDGTLGPWADAFRAWRWTRTAIAAGHVAVRRPLEQTFNCLLPLDLPARYPARIARRHTHAPWITTLWHGRNLIAEQLRNASESEQRSMRSEARSVARSRQRFLDAEASGKEEEIYYAAGDVLVAWGQMTLTIQELREQILDKVFSHTSVCVPEAAEAAAARECFSAAEQLDATASRALLTYSGYLGFDLAAAEEEAAEALFEAHRALYGNPWES
jgi:hypothetical protein